MKRRLLGFVVFSSFLLYFGGHTLTTKRAFVTTSVKGVTLPRRLYPSSSIRAAGAAHTLSSYACLTFFYFFLFFSCIHQPSFQLSIVAIALEAG